MKTAIKSDPHLLVAIIALVLGLPALYFLGYFAPQAEPSRETDGVFLYYGEDGKTLPATALAPALADITRSALRDTEYFGAFAIGPAGRSGLWTGARTLALARSYALARCGDGCSIVAERVPVAWDRTRSEPLLTPAMARNAAGLSRPYSRNLIVLGGANAWGYGTKPSGRVGWRIARQDGLEDCALRRAAEPTFTPDISPPCAYMQLTEIVDLRPKPRLYPAPYSMGLTELAPVEKTRLVRLPTSVRDPFLGPILPKHLHGARAGTDGRTEEYANSAGWPEAGDAIALLRCDAARRPQEMACVVTHRRVPDPPPPEGVLAVPPDLFEAYLVWQKTEGPGAFAISPYGTWGSSSGMRNGPAAIQRAADWCWYYTRRTFAYREMTRDFLILDMPCRIIAVRSR